MPLPLFLSLFLRRVPSPSYPIFLWFFSETSLFDDGQQGNIELSRSCSLQSDAYDFGSFGKPSPHCDEVSLNGFAVKETQQGRLCGQYGQFGFLLLLLQNFSKWFTLPPPKEDDKDRMFSMQSSDDLFQPMFFPASFRGWFGAWACVWTIARSHRKVLKCG